MTLTLPAHIHYRDQLLHIEDVALDRLAAEYGTPLFVYSEQSMLDALAAYRSQAQKAYTSEDFVYSLARTRGVQIGANFAECFETIRLVV